MKNVFRTPAPMAPLPPLGEGASESEIDAWEEHELKRLTLETELPHLYGWKWYPWAAAFRDSTNQINLLCAANQISKSSTQIRKVILWATDQDLWKTLWAKPPVQFWYLYPTQKQVNAEFETKWKQFLPKGEMQKDEYFGWRVEKNKNDVIAIHFKSGVHVYFKTYAQDEQALQTGTCDAIFCDEELPIHHFDELMLRISASSGYFHMVFTATLGQNEWRLCMEPTDDERADGKEFLPQAFKQTVSLYDAMEYEDGSASMWTMEKIKAVESRCSTQQQVLKRVYGRFIVIEGRKYESFDLKRHMKPKHPLPASWIVYAAADVGSGGSAHKPAICFVAVRPDFRAGRVFLGWRGDDPKEVFTAGDVYLKYKEMEKDLKRPVSQKWYDWASKDFGTIAARAGDSFEKAEKSHEKGEEVINTLFKHDMLYIFEDKELAKLGGELATLKADAVKRVAKDDFCDALRYCVTLIPWDWSVLTGAESDLDEKPVSEKSALAQEIDERRKAFDQDQNEERMRIEDEIEEWNELY